MTIPQSPSMYSTKWQMIQTGTQLIDLFRASKVNQFKDTKDCKAVKEFVGELKGLLDWLRVCDKEGHDPVFTSWLIHLLENTPGIMHYQFETSLGRDVLGTVTGLNVLAKENWIDDYSICRVAEYFQYRYQDHDTQQPIVIPFYHLVHWRCHLEIQGNLSDGYPCDWEKGTFIDGQNSKVFAVVQMGDHWGAACIDFKERRVYFGDSMKRTFPSDARKAIARWLVHIGMDLTKWDPCVHLFHVPRQVNSGSCGVIALNTIERVLNGKLSIWTNGHAACHRLRLMQLMTGYSSLKCDVACLTSKGMHYVKSKVGEAPLSRRKADSEPLYNKEELDTWVRQAQDLAAKRDMELRDSAKMERCKRKDLRRQKDEELRFARWRDWDNNSPKQEIKACGLSIGNRSVGDEPKRGDCNSGDFEGGKDGHVEVGNGSEGLEELGGSNKSDEDKCVNHDKDGGKGVQEHGIGGFIESKRAHGDYGGTKDNQGPGIEGVIECSKTGVENT
ncbi:hypothetical protein BGX20_005370, partial [Mortierella sp. AD010]